MGGMIDPRLLAAQMASQSPPEAASASPPASPMFQNPQGYIEQAGQTGIQPTPFKQVNPQSGAVEDRPLGSGRHARLRRALGDALFALSTGLSEHNIGAGIQAAMPSFQARALAAQQQAREEAAAQRLQQAGMGTGRMYGGFGAMARAGAEQTRADAYATGVGARANLLNAQAGRAKLLLQRTASGAQRIFDIEKNQYEDGAAPTDQDEGFLPPEVASYFGVDPGVARPIYKMAPLMNAYNSQFNRPTPTMGGEIITTKSGKPVANIGTAPSAVQAQISGGRLALSNKVFERDTFGTLFGNAIPTSLVDDQGNAIGWKSPASPTTSVKQMGQQSADLGKLFVKVNGAIDKLDAAGKLGPVAGRINEVMAGRIGADDPDFAELRALGSLTASGMLRAHFGARGGQQMYDHFQNLFDTGKMTAGDLKGAMSGFKTFMDQYASRVRTAGQIPKGGTVPYTDGKRIFDIPAGQLQKVLKSHPELKRANAAE